MKPKNEDAEVIEVDVGGEKKKIVMAPGKLRWYSSSVVDPDPVGSETFCRIRIRIKSFRVRIRPIPNFSVKKSHFLNQMHKKSEYLAHIYVY